MDLPKDWTVGHVKEYLVCCFDCRLNYYFFFLSNQPRHVSDLSALFKTVHRDVHWLLRVQNFQNKTCYLKLKLQRGETWNICKTTWSWKKKIVWKPSPLHLPLFYVSF
jgi:hypothetical protein